MSWISRLNFHKAGRVLLISVLIVLASHSLTWIIGKINILDALEHSVLDFDFTDIYYSSGYSKPQTLDSTIVLVNIGELSREEIARQIEVINRYKPKVLAIDVFFSDEYDSLGFVVLQQSLSQTDNLVLINSLQPDKPSPPFDSLMYLGNKKLSNTTSFGFANLNIPTEDPGRGTVRSFISRATIMGTLLTTFIYIAGTVAVMGLIPPSILQDSQAPFADAAASIWGEEARYLVAGGAVISTFGALNGWILIQGQMPMAAARDHLFPRIFAKENKNGTPAIGIVISSLLISVLMSLNFTRTLADTYTFMVLLTTLTVLVPYLFSIISFVMIASKRETLSGFKLVIAVFAFLYSMWAIIGAGEETVYWGFVLLMAGLPFYAYIQIKRNSSL